MSHRQRAGQVDTDNHHDAPPGLLSRSWRDRKESLPWTQAPEAHAADYTDLDEVPPAGSVYRVVLLKPR